MALYRNKVLVSGIRDYPAMTWAEYQALPVAQRPKKWICTDRDYTEIPPEEILSSATTITANGTNTSIPLTESLDGDHIYTIKYKDFQGYGNAVTFVPNPTTAKVLIQTLYTHTTASKCQLLIMNKTWAMWLFDGTTSSNSIQITSVLKKHL